MKDIIRAKLTHENEAEACMLAARKPTEGPANGRMPLKLY
jgi:hypothetical protein